MRMKTQWHRYESQVRLAGFLIIVVVLVQNVMLTWLFFQAKNEARRQLESRLFLAADQSRQVWAARPPARPDSVLARWRRLNLSAGCLNTGVIDRDGRLALATDSAAFSRGDGPLAGLDAASYRVLDETGRVASARFDRQGRPLVRYYLKAGMNGGILATDAPADFLRALDGVARFELWSSAVLLALVLILSAWYFNSVLAPFRQMAEETRRSLGDGGSPAAPDVAFVMDVYQRAVDDLRSKGTTLQQLYDKTRTEAERSQALNREILDSLDKGVITVGEDGRVMSHNAAAARILRCDGAAPIQAWIDGQRILSRLASQRQLNWEQPGPGNGTRTVQVESGPLRDTGGAGLGRILILSDVTSLRALEEQAALYDRTRWLNQSARQLYQKVLPMIDGLRRECGPDGPAGGALGARLADIERSIGDFSTNLAYYPAAGQPAFSEVIVHRSEAMRQVLDLVAKVAPSDSTVLITGESGTGKELLAHEIHRLSRRSQGPFISLNCGALPESLLESELFGYVKGAFTGALRDKPGLLKAAQGGTFFLDEVADLSPALQVKLLRVVQEREAMPVGSTAASPIDIRLIAATNQDLGELVKAGKFRQDLFFRLNVFPVRVPPLRQRPEDIAVLAEAILKKLGKRTGKEVTVISDDAYRLLAAHPWPGNVRELENLLERALLLAQGPVLESGHLRLQPEAGDRPATAPHGGGGGLLEVSARAAAEAESRLIRETLRQVDGNKSEASRRLKISYRVMLKKIKDYGLES
jgi:transcriptional regulator with PAS, ATPase and Fis domain